MSPERIKRSRAKGWRKPDGAIVVTRPTLRSLKTRGLSGVQLVISDAHAGLQAAIAAVPLGASWQRSSVNIVCGGTVPLVHLRRRERTLATRP
jgi:mutator family transposase